MSGKDLALSNKFIKGSVSVSRPRFELTGLAAYRSGAGSAGESPDRERNRFHNEVSG
jgi:hypothetical protein